MVFKNSSVIALLPPTNIVIPLRGGSGTGSGELGAGEVVFEVEETKLLYKFCIKLKKKCYHTRVIHFSQISCINTVNFVVDGAFGVLSGISVFTGEAAENG